jgi:hypothetical protein
MENSNGMKKDLEVLTIFIRPNGKIIPIASPSSHPFMLARYPSGHPEQAQLVSGVTSKQKLYRNFFHYIVGRPTSNKWCRGCGKFIERDSLCIQTQLICIPDIETPF